MHHILFQESLLKGWLFFFFEILIFPIIDGVNVIYLSIALFVVAGFILFIYLFIDSLLLFQKHRLLCDAFTSWVQWNRTLLLLCIKQAGKGIDYGHVCMWPWMYAQVGRKGFFCMHKIVISVFEEHRETISTHRAMQDSVVQNL